MGDLQHAPGTMSSWKPRKMSSKYDFVKVRVHLSWPSGNYYVLSRYLISRVLTVIKIPYEKAVKISMQLKKYLVDHNTLEVSQEQMEYRLFIIMVEKGYGDPFIERYKLMNRFFQQKKPVLILICGAPYTGKSTLAQQLAARLNLPNVLQTDLIYELLRNSADSPLHSSPLWHRAELSDSCILSEYQRECCIVRKGVSGEINKVLSEGKSMIFEGVHLDPSLYINELAAIGIHVTRPTANPEDYTRNSCGVSSNKGNSQLEQNPQDLLNNNVALPRDANSTDKNKTTVEYHEENGANQEHKQDNILSSELAPLFIPVVVTVEKGDHKVLASQWCPDSQNKIEFGEVFNKLRYLNDYLRNTSAREVIVASLDISCLATTLDQLHDHFLKCVEESMISKE